MPNIRSTGIFADESASDGLYRGTYIASSKVKVPGVPIDVLAQTEVVSYFNDFQHTLNDFELSTFWEAADVGTVTVDPSTFLITESGRGALRLIADATAGDGNSVSRTTTGGLLTGLTPTANTVITWESEFNSSDWDANHWFAGLFEDTGGAAVVDTNGDMLGSLEFVGFHYNDDDDTAGVPVLLAAGANNTEVATTASETISAGVDDTYRRFGLRIEGTDKIEWYVDGRKKGEAVLASAFTAPLFIAYGAVNNEGVADTFDIDWVLTSQTRG